MRYKRRFHACTGIEEENGSLTKVLVVSGRTNSGLTCSSEIYNIEYNYWSDGPAMVEAVWSSALVSASASSDVGAYLIAGYNGNDRVTGVYAISKNLDQWTLVGNISQKRTEHVAVRIPPNIIKGCPIND